MKENYTDLYSKPRYTFFEYQKKKKSSGHAKNVSLLPGHNYIINLINKVKESIIEA